MKREKSVMQSSLDMAFLITSFNFVMKLELVVQLTL